MARLKEDLVVLALDHGRQPVAPPVLGPGEFVVKVQLSIATTHAKSQVLLYSEDRSIMWQGDASEDLVEVMDGDARAFFAGKKRRDGQVEIGERLGEQGW